MNYIADSHPMGLPQKHVGSYDGKSNTAKAYAQEVKHAKAQLNFEPDPIEARDWLPLSFSRNGLQMHAPTYADLFHLRSFYSLCSE